MTDNHRRTCRLWEPREEGTEKQNCGTCRHYVWGGLGRCNKEIKLLKGESLIRR